MTVNTIFEPALDENEDRTTIVCWRLHFSEPGVLIGIPARYLLGQSFRSAIGHSFGNDLVASFQQPTNMIVAPCSSIQTPNSAFGMGWS
jgi:hypothetical protein